MSIDRLAARIFTGRLQRFSNRHRGESCYVFGDGPSIKWFDLALLNRYPAFCCGMIPFHRDFGKLDVRYVTFIAPWMFLPMFLQPRMYRPLAGIAAEYRNVVRDSPEKEFFVNLSNAGCLSGANVNYVHRGWPRSRNRTDQLLREFDLFGGSFYASLALAYYMGFTKLHLVGFDAWTIQPSRNMHWYERGSGEFFDATNLATEFLDIIKAEVDVCTISLDGESRNTTNISYSSHTGQAPRYRENDELLDAHHLNVLASYPGYKIFPSKALRAAPPGNPA